MKIMNNKNKKLFQIKYKFLLFFLFQSYLYLILCSNYISFKLINYNNEQISNIPDNSFNYEHFINISVINSIYTTIKIGNPNQFVKTWIDSDEYSYYLYKDICLLDSYYNENDSLSFEPNLTKTYFYKGYGEAFYINETFTLENNINENNNEIIIKQFPILFMKDPKNDKRFNDMHSIEEITNKTCATIGFRYMDNFNDKDSKDFLITLKQKEIIDDYIVFIEYDKNGNEEYLILGGYPEEVFKNKYDIKYQHTTYIKFFYQYIYQWGLSFDKIYSGEDYKFYKVEAAFHYNLGVIYGIQEYQSYIEKYFFNDYINLKICKLIVYKNYELYECDREKFTIKEMKKFPQLNFFKADFEASFSLTYEDLFFIKGNKVYFLIVFHHILKEVWELGKPFLKKYSFAFNFDSKLVWYYKNNNNDNNNKNNNKSFSNGNIIFICAIIFLSIILGILSFFLGKMLYNKKKKLKKAEELTQEEDFNYENYENKIN